MFKNLTQRFRYGGDISTYRSKLLKTIHSEQYHTGYSDSPIVFLRKWEDAAVRYNRVAESGCELSSNQLLDYLSIGFKVINDTENIIEQAKDTTSAFDKLTGALRTKLKEIT